eukprot:sb/3471739/
MHKKYKNPRIPTEISKPPIKTLYLGHVTGYQPIRDQYFLVTHPSHTLSKPHTTRVWVTMALSSPLSQLHVHDLSAPTTCDYSYQFQSGTSISVGSCNKLTWNGPRIPTEISKPPIKTLYLGHVTGYQPIRDQYFLVTHPSNTHWTHHKDMTPRFSDRINFPRYRKLTVFDPELVATPI